MTLPSIQACVLTVLTLKPWTVKGWKTDINPSFGVIYDVNPNLSVSGNLIYATRSPRFADAILSRGYRGGVISIDDNAKAEKARNTEIGFNYNNGPYTAFGSYFWQRG